jgi:hypothetical protein
VIGKLNLTGFTIKADAAILEGSTRKRQGMNAASADGCLNGVGFTGCATWFLVTKVYS